MLLTLIANDETKASSYSNCYLCQFRGTPSEQDRNTLQRVLNAQISDDIRFSNCIGPRKSCQSPWSSKCLDLLRNAHCTIEKIEKFQIFSEHVQKAEIVKNFDKMTQQIYNNPSELYDFFISEQARQDATIDLQTDAKATLETLNKKYALALSDTEIQYLIDIFTDRNPTLTEICMFAQANSEHCRHKIFNSTFTLDQKEQAATLFAMIKNTYRSNPEQVEIAYIDNAAVLQGAQANYFHADATGKYCNMQINLHPVLKVETHNHPTAISPYPGAATGSGGEIRDEVATGRGAKPIAGLTGFMVSNLRLPNNIQPWETHPLTPNHIASALQIMLEAPIGAARFNNEFGRANLCGFFRSMQIKFNNINYGYHKPIMLAGGLGHILEHNIHKQKITAGNLLVVLGGPSMEIGLGGGAASSVQNTGENSKLDFASVQRDNAEMQRRATEVILRCCESTNNPIISLHDVGAGGLANALPELVYGSGFGAKIDFDKIHSSDKNMSPMQLWCNEAQERFVLAIDQKDIEFFEQLCARERSPYSIVGVVAGSRFIATQNDKTIIDVNLDDILGPMPKPSRIANTAPITTTKTDLSTTNIKQAIESVLQHPSVASKSFLITIGDRTIGGLNCRDQMVGPYQVPVADVATIADDFNGYTGRALAIGERSPIACLDAAASARMALAEAITNLAAADITDTSSIVCSANWMAACGDTSTDAELYHAVRAIGEEVCPQLGIAIPVGKDSLSMRNTWEDSGTTTFVQSPLTLTITATAAVDDLRQTLTPELKQNQSSSIVLLQLDAQKNLGGSILAECMQDIGGETPDLRSATKLRQLIKTLHSWRAQNIISAYHDRSDGGLIATLCEMAFATRCGIDITISDTKDVITELFNEEIGIVVQVADKHLDVILKTAQQHDFIAKQVARLRTDDEIIIYHATDEIYRSTRAQLQQLWSKVSFEICKLRDNPESAIQEYSSIHDNHAMLNYKFPQQNFSPKLINGFKPKIAILREQGINGQREMAVAFSNAGFECFDINMQDLLQNPELLAAMDGLAACGGFSYGDVLGAGKGWAASILEHPQLKTIFTDFFSNPNKFALGICNGCQMLTHLQSIIPGTQHWPQWHSNLSQQFEARLLQVEILESESILLKNMAGFILPAVIAHGEGRAIFTDKVTACARFVDGNHKVADQYPANPNGSSGGTTAVCNTDGRVTIMMPHPERIVRNINLSWNDSNNAEYTAWQQIFNNAYNWCNNRRQHDDTVLRCKAAAARD